MDVPLDHSGVFTKDDGEEVDEDLGAVVGPVWPLSTPLRGLLLSKPNGLQLCELAQIEGVGLSEFGQELGIDVLELEEVAKLCGDIDDLAGLGN